MCCYEGGGMIPIADGRRTTRCFGDGEMIGLAPGLRNSLISPDGLQLEPRNTSDVDCQVRPLIAPAAPPPPAAF
jgi:hypothetical protein